MHRHFAFGFEIPALRDETGRIADRCLDISIAINGAFPKHGDRRPISDEWRVMFPTDLAVVNSHA